MGMESRFLSGASSSLGQSNSHSRDGLQDEASSDIRMLDEPCFPARCLLEPRSAFHRALPRSAVECPALAPIARWRGYRATLPTALAHRVGAAAMDVGVRP